MLVSLGSRGTTAGERGIPILMTSVLIEPGTVLFLCRVSVRHGSKKPRRILVIQQNQ